MVLFEIQRGAVMLTVLSLNFQVLFQVLYDLSSDRGGLKGTKYPNKDGLK